MLTTQTITKSTMKTSYVKGVRKLSFLSTEKEEKIKAPTYQESFC